jgi:hypothetical protein
MSKEKLQEYLESIKGRPVVVKLNNGVDYRGKTFLLVLSAINPKLNNKIK